jgi:integrase
MGRRGNGEGSISRRKDGRWMGRYTVHTAEGPKQRAVYAATRTVAAEQLTKAMADSNGGLVFDEDNATVREYLERWLEDSVRGSVRGSTFESYRRQARRYLIPALGRVKLRKLTHVHVQHLYREMQDRGLSARTVQYTHAVLHRALKQPRRWNMVPLNVAEAVDVPKVEREDMRPLDARQTKQLLGAAQDAGDTLEALWVLAVHTGMRPGELLALKWEDVDIEAASLQVKRTLSTTGEFTAPKTKRSRRRIDLGPACVSALKEHRKAQLEKRLKRAGPWQDHGLVFPSSVGTPLSHRNVVRAFKGALKRAGLPEATRLYDLRHTCATLMLSRNVHAKYVQELLGHASIALTLDTYSHVLPGMDGGIATAVEDALG